MRDFKALHLLSNIFFFVGWVIIVLAVVVLIVGLIADEILIIPTILTTISVAFGGLISIAIAELIKLFIHMEGNAFQAKELLTKLFTVETKESKEKRNDFAEWQKQNPTKSINDYYKEKGH